MSSKSNTPNDQFIDASYYSTGAHRNQYDAGEYKVMLVIAALLAVSLLISLIPYDRIEKSYQNTRKDMSAVNGSGAAQVSDKGLCEAYEGIQYLPGLYVSEPPEYARNYFEYPRGVYLISSEIEELQVGDIITMINGEPTPDEETFLSCIQSASELPIEYRVYRNHRFETITTLSN